MPHSLNIAYQTQPLYAPPSPTSLGACRLPQPLAVLQLSIIGISWAAATRPPAAAKLLLHCGPHWLHCELNALSPKAAPAGGVAATAAAQKPPPLSPRDAGGAAATAGGGTTSSSSPSKSAAPTLLGAGSRIPAAGSPVLGSPGSGGAAAPTSAPQWRPNSPAAGASSGFDAAGDCAPVLEVLLPVYGPSLSLGMAVYQESRLRAAPTVLGRLLFRAHGLLPLLRHPRTQTLSV